MATIKKKGNEPWPQGVEEEFLTVVVRTLTVNGKRLTPAFYKQISEADLIDENTGDLCGVPLGYFHLHTKECPDIPHKHVLWSMETKLHLATIVARNDDPRYERQAELSTKKQRTFISLLALALALAGHTPIIEWIAEDRRKILIDGYTLYSSSTVADQLKRLEQARTQQKEDTRIWQERQLSDETFEQGRVEAKAMLEQLAEARVEVAHPASFQIERTSDVSYYDDLLTTSKWRNYPVEANREDALLCWRARDRWTRDPQEHFRESVEAILLSPLKARCLRLLLAEHIMQEQIQRTRKMAEGFIEAVALTPKKAAKKTAGESKLSTVEELDPDHLWRCYEEEAKKLKAYTEQWDEQLSAINGVGQLFLV